MYEISVSHTIDAGHRVVGHQNPDGSPGKCSRLHGHTYRFDVMLAGKTLLDVGFLIDFGDVKRVLDLWDHRTLLWDQDDLVVAASPQSRLLAEREQDAGVVRLPFNPTAENMARYLSGKFIVLDGVEYAQVVVAETSKTTAQWTSRRTLV